MPMDDQTKATVRALLERYPRGYVAEEVGDTVTNTAAGLFRLLCLAVLADDTAPSPDTVAAARALFERGWGAAPEMAKADERELANVLAGAGYRRPERGSLELAQATRFVLDHYQGDLRNLRVAAGNDGIRLRTLLRQIPGLSGPGSAVFLWEAQMFWPEAGPFIDARAAEAAKTLGLPPEPDRLLADVARGGTEKLSWLVGALALVDAHDDYDQIRQAAHG